MTAKEIINPVRREALESRATVDADMPVIDVLPRLLESPSHEVGVKAGDETLGIIDRDSMLDGIGRMIAARDDCSIITLECRPEEYSASHIARAIEDSDAHLVDLLTSPGEDGNIMVTLRVRHEDPSAAVRSLERYDYHVVAAYGNAACDRDAEIAAERLLALQTLMNV